MLGTKKERKNVAAVTTIIFSMLPFKFSRFKKNAALNKVGGRTQSYILTIQRENPYFKFNIVRARVYISSTRGITSLLW